jgi:small conductance mechanosensitive channel
MVERARRARLLVLLILPLVAGVIIAYNRREDLFGVDLPVRIAAVIAMVILGWAFAREAGRAIGPTLFRRLDPGTAGTLGFLIRLFALLLSVLMALRIAGLQPRTIAVGARSRRWCSDWPPSRPSDT